MSSNMEHICCPICNASDWKNLLTISSPDRFEKAIGVSEIGYSRSWLGCSCCSVAVNIYPSGLEQQLDSISDKYYEIDLGPGNILNKYNTIMSLPHSKSDNALRVDRICRYLDRSLSAVCAQPMRVVDIGAGTGVFLSKFIASERERNRLWHCLAVEPDPIAAQHLRDLHLFDVEQAYFSSSKYINEFALCTLNKVLEHLGDPLELLKNIRHSLTGSGVLYVEVPSVETIEYRDPSDSILGPLHKRLYSPAALSMVLSQAGYIVLHIETILEPSGKITTFAFAEKRESAERIFRGR